MEYGGGIGDIFSQIYSGSYNVLRDLKPEDTAEIILVCHNPHAKELFDNLPNRGQITIRDVGYFHANSHEEAIEIRKKLGLPATYPSLPPKDGIIRFYPNGEDKKILEEVTMDPFIVISAGAGLPERNIPQELLDTIVVYLNEYTNYKLILVGRNYDRHGRFEPIPSKGNFINLIDKLTIPGTAALVQEASGLITAHSSLNILGWCERISQLLLYPQSVLDRHMPNGKPDQWLYGIGFPETVHTKFEDFKIEDLQNFIKIVNDR